ncbi:MAG: alpha-L-fucosidase [Williamsia sp.]|nr:alpha-L-fucosidase [Williamsia sp.]
MKKRLLLAGSILSALAGTAQKKYEATWESINSRPVPAWFTDAKFGIFIHWGLYSVPSWAPVDKELNVYSKYAEWYWKRLVDDTGRVGQAFRAYHKKTYGDKFQYTDFAGSFKAELFNPAQWADLFVASGARYVVLTSKHHEGFTLWPSKESWNWNAVDVGPHRDLLGDLTAAVKNKGLRMGYYYSLYEWYNPLYKEDVNRYVDEHMMPQMKDLVTRYKPDIFWTDGEWDHPSAVWKSTQFLSWLYNESAVRDDVVVNDRWGKETRSKDGGIYTTEYDLVHDANSKETKITHPWEECRGIGSSFGLNRNEGLEEYNSSEQLVHTLVEKVAKGGNLLLDIGPAADGSIPGLMQQRLMDIGNWLKVNGEAIYGTKSWDGAPAYSSTNPCYYTRKGNALYVICTRFPEKELVVKNVKKPGAVHLLGYQGAVKTSYGGSQLKITPPAITPANNPCNYAWVFKVESSVSEP